MCVGGEVVGEVRYTVTTLCMQELEAKLKEAQEKYEGYQDRVPRLLPSPRVDGPGQGLRGRLSWFRNKK